MTGYEILQWPPLLIGLTVLLGLFLGSFVNVVIHRLPIMMEREWRRQCEELTPAGTGSESERPATGNARFDLIAPRSHCPACSAPIKAWQNIPVLSYLFLAGRCANCRARISLRYPVVELLTALLSGLAAWRFGLSWELGAALAFTWSLIALSGIDLDHQLLPDSITLPLLWLGLLLSLAYRGDSSFSIPADPRSSIIGAAAGYLSLWSVYHLFRLLTGKEGMGFGDFKLFAVFGAWFGWQMLLPIILMAAATGAVVGIALLLLKRHGRDVPIPFGPYLAAAGWIALLWGPQLVDRYLHISGLR
ncbi:MAG TPA: A24 family peptidase [Steroidobacteraceae bacterium]|jgi:leader peptidase (prepilin peptidase)/N-methyltransferase|nr:A24 family peptidase [Steroidobacteraceae bacterium]